MQKFLLGMALITSLAASNAYALEVTHEGSNSKRITFPYKNVSDIRGLLNVFTAFERACLERPVTEDLPEQLVPDGYQIVTRDVHYWGKEEGSWPNTAILSKTGMVETDFAGGYPIIDMTMPTKRSPYGKCGVTRHTYLQRIHAMAKILAPENQWGWLGEIVLDLKDNARPRSKTARIVSSERLLQLGLDLIERAKQANGQTQLQRARLYRNGLMIALLALCPIRLRNLAELELGKQIVEEEGAWWIRLKANETKSGRPDERPIPQILSTAISQWIDHWKPLFCEPSARLWASTKGGGLAYTYVGTIITETTQKELGIPVNPHLFRDCAVYTIAHHAGQEMGTASALLQHTDPRVTEKHYNRGRSIEAVKGFHNILDKLPSE